MAWIMAAGHAFGIAPARDGRFAQYACAGVACLSVAASVALIGIAGGTEQKISGLVGDPALKRTGLLDIDLIVGILHQLTVAIIGVMLLNVAVTSVVLGQITMRSRGSEISIRRLHGALRRRLLYEFLLSSLLVSLCGAAAGAASGLAVCAILPRMTLLPVVVSGPAVWGAVLATVSASVIASIWPAWTAANTPASSMRRS